MHGRMSSAFFMRCSALSLSTHAPTWAVLEDFPQSMYSAP